MRPRLTFSLGLLLAASVAATPVLAADDPAHIQAVTARLKEFAHQLILEEGVEKLREANLRWLERRWEPGELEHSRDREMAPGPVAARSRAPRVAPESPAITLPNVRVNNPAGDVIDATQCEPAIAGWGAFVVLAWNDEPSNSDDFRGSHQGFGYSTDGGATFTDGGQVRQLNEDTFWTSDPSLVVNENTGEFYYCGMIETLPDVITGQFDEGVAVVRGTVVGGVFSWDAPRVVRLHPISQHFLDKCWLAIDSETGNLYVTYTDFYSSGNTITSDIVFQRSTDRGATWSAPLAMNSPTASGYVQGSRPAVGPSGEVYVTWFEVGPASAQDFIRIRKSTDRGGTFASGQTVASIINNFGSGAPGFNREVGFSFPSITVDRSLDATRGRVYVAWNESIDFFDDIPPIGVALPDPETGDLYRDNTPFTPGQTITGTFRDSIDFDTFTFSALQGVSYVFWCDSVPESNYRIRLICGDTLTRLAYSGHPFGDDTENNEGLIVWTAPESGVYYLRMVAEDNTGGFYRVRTGTVDRDAERGRDHRDVFVASSADGSTWTTPVRVNDDAPHFDNWMPEISVTNEADVYLLWYDWRDAPAGRCAGVSHTYLAHSTDAGATWTSLGPVTDVQTYWTPTPFGPPPSVPVTNANLIPNQGDYLALLATEEAVYAGWSDGRDGTPDIYSATLQLLADSLQTVRSSALRTDGVEVTWRFRVPRVVRVNAYRELAGVRELVQTLDTGPDGIARVVDTGVDQFNAYIYRIGVQVDGSEDLIGRILVDVPGTNLHLRPNPVRTSTQLAYTLPAGGGDVTLDVFDLQGRKVKNLVDGYQAAGNHFETWDGRSDDGVRMPAGVYFARLVGPQIRFTQRLVLVP
jgi:hypothetical protein